MSHHAPSHTPHDQDAVPQPAQYRRYRARMQRCQTTRQGGLTCFEATSMDDFKAVLLVGCSDALTILIHAGPRLWGLVDQGVWRGWYPTRDAALGARS